MDGTRRRNRIMEILSKETSPVSGTELARRVGVSRQAVVQDVALLRAQHEEILSTNKGYLLRQAVKGHKKECVRVFCTSHATKDTLDELQTIVDCGGRLQNVSVEHEVYGQISVDLIINNRMDAAEFMDQLEKSQDQPLKSLTGGCHYHTVAADSWENLDKIEAELRKKGYLA